MSTPATALGELEQEFNQSKGNDPSIKLDFVDRQAPRYLFFGGDMPGNYLPNYPQGGVDIGSPCIPTRPRGYLARCAITPVLIGAQHVVSEMMPEGIPLLMQRNIGNSAFSPMAKDTSLSSYPILPGPEVDMTILPNYADWGVIELTTLRGKDWREVAALKLEKRFFPDYPNLPEKNTDVIALIDEAIVKLKAEYEAARTAKASKADLQAILDIVDIGLMMKKGLVQTEAFMRGILEDTHGKMSLATTDPFRKAKYDNRDVHFLRRTGIERTDGFIESQVRKQAENQQDVAALTAELVKFLASREEKQTANEAALIEALNRLAPSVPAPPAVAAEDEGKAKRK